MKQKIINWSKNWSNITSNSGNDLLFLTAITTIWSAIIYYLYALNSLGIIISLILIISSFIILRRYWKKEATLEIFINEQKSNKRGNIEQTFSNILITKIKNNIFLIVYSLLYIILTIQLFSSRSGQAFVSPWQVINHSFFVSYSLASLFLVFIILKKDIKNSLKIFLISAHYLISLSVVIIVYKIGYGFDPFIHQATMKLIDSQGLVSPKTPYYLGEYGLIIIIHKISGLSISLLNKLLVPGLTALFFPLATYRFLKKENSSHALLSVFFLLILTFSPFVFTTPQNLSYLFLILTILASFNYSNLTNVYLLALATCAIHPLTGLPALIFTLWLTFKKYQTKITTAWQKAIKTIISILMAGILPLSLLLAGGGKWSKIKDHWPLLLKSFNDLLGFPSMTGQENWLANFIYFFAHNYSLLGIIVIIIAIFYYYRQSPQKNNQDAILKQGLLFLSSALLISYLLSKQIIFSDLIVYERADFANRLPIIISIFLLPFLIIFFNSIIIKIRQQKNINQIIWLILGLSLISTSLYLSYPRWDKYWNSHGYSTSENDIEAVKFIDKNSSQPYIVLADQQVSAAALQELGFNHYYTVAPNQVYFYPIPTGGPLYQYYLQMVYKNPDKKNMLEALNFVGVKTGYLIINRYWSQSELLIKEAKIYADKWWSINNQVYIFQYNL